MGPFKYRFDRVEDYIHHRPPYLMVGSIISIEASRILTKTELSADQFPFAGHFPGAPILPGAMMQEMTTQSAGILIAAEYNPMSEFDTHDPFHNPFALGVLVKVMQSRHRSFARPGDTLIAEVSLDSMQGDVFEFRGKVTLGGRSIMSNHFRLANIPSELLQGLN